MKILRGISEPFGGERVLRVQPPLSHYATKPEDGAELRRRLHLFAGRTLTHLALAAEQRGRMADCARLGAGVTAGVIGGLEVTLDGDSLLVSPGQAITTAGEDLELAYMLRVAADAIEVWQPRIDERDLGTDAARALDARRQNNQPISLGELRQANCTRGLPHAMVLVARPVTVAVDPRGEQDSPCPNAIGAEAYSELLWQDGFALAWVPWPAEISIPRWSEDGATLSPRFRNRLAHAIFNREAAAPLGGGTRSLTRWRSGERPLSTEALSTAIDWPWLSLGAPLALVGFDAKFSPVFADRNSVVRQGGGGRNRSPLLRGIGDDLLWQARVAQWLEHLAELPPDERSAARLAAQIEWLPPAGLLPRETVDFISGRQSLFPANFEVLAEPVPLESVDALLAEASPLAPFHLSVHDQLQLLVPVPARDYDPELLKLDEQVHPLFDSEIERLATQRREQLVRRDRLLRRFEVLERSIRGRQPDAPERDPNALADERGVADLLDQRPVLVLQAAAGARAERSFSGAQAPLDFAAGDALIAYVRLEAAPAVLALHPLLAAAGATAPTLSWGESALDNGVLLDALPDAEGWTRLSVPAERAGLVGQRLSGMQLIQVAPTGNAATVHWGYLGRLSRGREALWLSDALPPGAGVGNDAWDVTAPVLPASGDRLDDDTALGLPRVEGARQVTAVAQLIEQYQSRAGGVLKAELGDGGANPHPLDAGLDELILRLQHRIDGANDHVEFGFLRARTDIYRIRQSVLGSEEAGRLATSPSAAELVKRETSPVATEKEF
ncbi:MAG TPA: hypothetical protein VLI06_05650, partial [Solimonas sp.]|nr:hypothetical protein [Solimonas sp.]